ncbi:MAG: ribosome biogenesis GTP-binding protein YihA/YsxC [Deltaproteobacteria bacterium]|jgi:GTP-binding protein|nr:ribosome biogenesis GTP-binding protein YihA/YsxC [Deltaproteobacteria bacterium]
MFNFFPSAHEAKFLTGAVNASGFPEPAGLELAFMGRSNCGKSSTINRFLGRKALARVSSTPGRTREINFFGVTFKKGTEPFVIADLPGYGFARAPKELVKSWEALVGSYLESARNQKAILLADCRRSVAEDERVLLKTLEDLKIPAVLVATKSDKLTRTQCREMLKKWEDAVGNRFPILAFSAHTGEGRPELAKAVLPGELLAKLIPGGPGGGISP